MKPLCVVAEITDFPSLLDAYRTRLAELNTTLESIDHLCLFTKGHTSKLLKSVPDKRMSSDTMMTLMMGLGCKFLMVEDAQQMRRMALVLPLIA